MAVRYDRKFNSEIKRIVNNYNAKINRLTKTNKNIYIPQKFTAENINDLKTKAKTRADVRQVLKDLKEFSKRGNENYIEGTNTPIYLYKNIKRKQQQMNRYYNTKLKFYRNEKVRVAGKEQDTTFAQISDENYVNLLENKKRLKNKKLKLNDLSEMLLYNEQLQSKIDNRINQQWENTFLSIMLDTGYLYGYDNDKLLEIGMALEKLSIEEFDDLTKRDKVISAIVYNYKAIIDIGGNIEFENVVEDVFNNFDELYDHLEDIINYYKEPKQDVVKKKIKRKNDRR